MPKALKDPLAGNQEGQALIRKEPRKKMTEGRYDASRDLVGCDICSLKTDSALVFFYIIDVNLLCARGLIWERYFLF